jgi:hypothetical protein
MWLTSIPAHTLLPMDFVRVTSILAYLYWVTTVAAVRSDSNWVKDLRVRLDRNKTYTRCYMQCAGLEPAYGWNGLGPLWAMTARACMVLLYVDDMGVHGCASHLYLDLLCCPCAPRV